jgi:hypothetical protein
MFVVCPALASAKTVSGKAPGQIVAIDKKAHTITIRESATKNVTYSVSEQTRVLVNGQKSTFSHLSTKMKASVTHPQGSTTVDYIDAHKLVKARRRRI